MGVKDYRLGNRPHKDIVSTAAEFVDLSFFEPHHGSRTYIRFVCSFLSDFIRSSVFMDEYIRQDNVLVELNQGNYCVVT